MAGWILNLFGVIISLICNLSGGRTLIVTPDKGTTVTISRQGTGGSSCDVCVKEGSKQQCTTKLTLSNNQEMLVDFTCDSPERLFTVDFKRKIVCKGTVCDGDITQKEPPLFQKFNRTFTWDLTPDRPRSFQLAFSSMGMRQIPPSETCPDQHTYTVTVTQPTGNATVGTFCQNGSISSIQALSQSRVVLQVPGGRSLDPNVFRVSVGPEIKTFAVVKVTVPDGASTAEFFSPNYPGSFPDDDLMTWNFHFPPRHNFTMRFLNYTEPRCVKKEVVVEYHRPSTVFIGKRLTDPQPANRQGDFSLFLRNCEMERRAVPGLSLHFQVSVVKTRISGKCDVDLQKEKGVTLQIEKRNLNSNCTMKLNEKVQNMVTMASGSMSKLFFQDCQIEELMVTVSKSIECQQWEGCQVSRVPLSVPALPACVPTPLRKIVWHLSVPEHGTVELLHPGAYLHQVLPGQPCNASFSLAIAEDGGVAVGTFCPGGSIQKVQIHSNVSITAMPTLGGDLHQASKPFLKVSFHREIVESYIFTVVPQKGVPVRLATPGWPEGMKASSTVSWIVSVPSKYQANLLFLNISQPKCKQQHTHMKVQTLGSREEMFSRREDEARADQLSVPGSFYLNMSNCLPELRDFSVLSEITVQRKTKLILGTILGTIGALLLLMIVVLIVVCVVVRKKKKQMSPKFSIYNPNGGTFAPGHPMQSRFPKSRADNESHIYASIEDTMVYGHLLRDSAYPGSGGPEVDVYRTFTGPVEAPAPPFPNNKEKVPEVTDPEVGVYRHFISPSECAPPGQDMSGGQGEKMVENELYSIRSNGLPSPPSE